MGLVYVTPKGHLEVWVKLSLHKNKYGVQQQDYGEIDSIRWSRTSPKLEGRVFLSKL